ncbi:MAG: AI-2E family transporter [Atopobiaceae bacterium]|nr:AI-2E family transporter [Atopobiaceae bacterium]
MKLLEKLDEKYVKICVYVVATALIVFIGGLVIWSARDVAAAVAHMLAAAGLPLLLGAMIAYLIHPLTMKVTHLITPKDQAGQMNPSRKALATTITLVLIVLAILLLLVLVGMLITKSVTSISFDIFNQIWQNIQVDFAGLIGWISQAFSLSGLPDVDFAGVIEKLITGLSSGVTTIFFGCIFATFFLYDGNRLLGYIKRVVKGLTGKDLDRKHSQLLSDADRVFSTYIRGQVVDALIVGMIFAVALALIGVPFGMTIGILGGIGNLIPGMGWMIAAVLTIIVGVTQNQIVPMVIGLVAVVVINLIDANFIAPHLMTNKLHIHPLLVLAALLVGGAAAGVSGMLIAIPTATLIKLRFDRWIAQRLEKN